MAQIYNLQKYIEQRQPSQLISSTLCLNDIKIKLIDYFKVESIREIKIAPAKTNCPYETLLLKVCEILMSPNQVDKAEKIAEFVYTADLRGLSLSGFIETLGQDDMILGCFQTELSHLTELDQLFLINVLMSRFPQEKALFSFCKTLLFAKQQENKLEARIV